MRLYGLMMVVVSAVSFGVMPIFARAAYADGMSTTTLLFLRFAAAAAVMLGYIGLKGLRLPDRRTVFLLAAMGGLGYVGQSFSYFTALKYASAGLVALLLYVHPSLVALLSAVVFGDRLSSRRGIALLMASAGTALIIGFNISGSALGVLFGLSAAVIYSVYIVAGSRIIPEGGEIQASALIMTAAAIVYGFLAFAEGSRFPVSAGGIAAVLGLALVSTVVAILTFFLGMRRIGPTNAAMVSTLEPVVTVVLAALLLGETLKPMNAVGGVLIVAAVLILTRAEAPAAEVDAERDSA